MARINKDQIITSIDVGTTKICVLIGKKIAGQIEVIGIGKAASNGLQKGVVVDVAKTINAISLAVKEAEIMAGISIDSASIGISGSHIKSLNSSGVIALKHGMIRYADVVNVLEAAQAVPVEQGYQILHVIPQYYKINGQDVVIDPVGMHGVRLEVQAHVILGSVSSVQNLLHCCQSAGVTVSDIVLEQLASAEAVLSADELDFGVGLLDIGGGTSDFAVYKHSTVRHTMVLPVAGNHLTQDIAIGLRIMKDEAERIKKQYGCASLHLLDDERVIEVEMMQGTDLQVVRQSDLVRIIEYRIRELFELVNDEIVRYKLQHLMTNGIVLTGGGSLLEGASIIAEKIFDCSVRIGKPRVFFDLLETLQSPTYATGYGLLLYMMKNEQKIKTQASEGPLVKRVFERMKLWVVDFF